MKRKGPLIAIVFVAIVSVSIYLAFKTGTKSQFYVTAQVEVAESLSGQSSAARVLYLVLFDANAPMPMPYGALRYPLDENERRGLNISINVTKERLQIMNPNLPPPKYFRVKARLDLDGQAGPDQPGDLVGEQSRVKFGEKTSITINKRI